MDRLSVLQKISDAIHARTYLEIGVQTGGVISRLKVSTRIGVDPFPMLSRGLRLKTLLGISGFRIFPKTSDAFFADDAETVLRNGLDLAFVDGLHTYAQALRDAQNCLRWLSPGGVIVLHDCNPLCFASAYPVKQRIEEAGEAAARGEIPGWTGEWNGDVWKALVHLRLQEPGLKVLTLDLDQGLGILVRGAGTKLEGVGVADLAAADYHFLERNRERLLDLKPADYLDTFLCSLASQLH
jgi:hypothetical protein